MNYSIGLQDKECQELFFTTRKKIYNSSNKYTSNIFIRTNNTLLSFLILILKKPRCFVAVFVNFFK